VVLVKDPHGTFTPIDKAESEVDQDSLLNLGADLGIDLNEEDIQAAADEVAALAALGMSRMTEMGKDFLAKTELNDFFDDPDMDEEINDLALLSASESTAADFSADNVDSFIDQLSGGGSLSHLSIDVPGREKKAKKVRTIDKLRQEQSVSSGGGSGSVAGGGAGGGRRK
jgi:hypothetical protein